MSTTVVHCQRDRYDIYIGRPSEFGNPFLIGVDGTRSQVINKYEIWMRAKMNREPAVRGKVKALYGKVLGCWCVPLDCHGDVLVKLAEELNR